MERLLYRIDKENLNPGDSIKLVTYYSQIDQLPEVFRPMFIDKDDSLPYGYFHVLCVSDFGHYKIVSKYPNLQDKIIDLMIFADIISLGKDKCVINWIEK